MAEPFLGEIRLFSFNFAPKGWAMCNGQLLAINQNQALFSLLGTTFGGDGRVNFALPNAQGRCLAHPGLDFLLGESFGAQSVTLTSGNLPAHTHALMVATGASGHTPAGSTVGVATLNPRMQTLYSSPVSGEAASQLIGQTGGGQAHENSQPYLVLNYCIALQGIFPSRD